MKNDGTFSKKDKILMHLRMAELYVTSRTAPRSFSQDGIAEAIHITRAHAALELARLKKQGLIQDSIKHVPGKNRQVKVYTPTFSGRQMAMAFMKIREGQQ